MENIGKNVEVQTCNNGEAPLHLAAWKGHFNVCNYISQLFYNSYKCKILNIRFWKNCVSIFKNSDCILWVHLGAFWDFEKPYYMKFVLVGL